MAKEREELNVAFEEEAEVQDEFVREGEEAPDPDAELPEEEKKKSKTDLFKEAQALRESAASRPDTTDAVVKAFEKVAEKLTPREREVIPAPALGETEEQFVERLKVDLFDEKKVGTAMRDAVLRYAGPMLQQQNAQTYETTLKLMRLDPDLGPTFRRYEAEVLAYVRAKFKGYEQSPQALELAFNQVRSSHVQEIAQEIADKKIEEMRKNGGLEGLPEGRKKEPLTLESGGGTSGAPARRVVRQTFTVTAQDEQEAEMRGVSPEVIARARARRVAGR